MDERKIIMLNDNNGAIKRIALTQEQINLLNWLSENNWLYEETTWQEEENFITI
jgi:hypothetical protein